MNPEQVVRNDERSRYELVVDGAVAGFAQFARHGDTVRLIHTEIDAAHGGKGYGSKLAAAVLADIRAQGCKVQADCEFMAAYLARHPAP